MAIDLILLHLASVETDDTQAVITIPETSSKPEFDRKSAHDGIDYLIAKYPKGHMGERAIHSLALSYPM